MLTLSQRQYEILSMINGSDSYVISDTLTEHFHITRRTLISDIKYINSQGTLILSSNRGYRIAKENRELLDEVLISHDKAEHNGDSLLKYLLTSRKAVSLDQLAEEFYVSPTTMVKYLNAAGRQLVEYGLAIQRKKNLVTIVGDEKGKRKLMENLIRRESPYFFSDIENFSSYFPNIDVGGITKLVLNTVDEYGYYVPEFYKINFLINALVILSRNPFTIDLSAPTKSDSITKYPQRVIAHEIVNTIAVKYHMHYINILETVRELEQALYGFIHPKGDENAVPTVHDLSDSFIRTIRKILEEVFAYYYLNTINYETFLNVFCLHVSELIKRCSNSMNFTPDNVSLRTRSPYIYEIAVSISNRIASTFQIRIPESEINLIAVHIGYSVEQAVARASVCPIVILTENYQEEGKYIAQTLTRKLPSQVQILGFYHSLEDIPYRTLKECLIVSTIQPEEMPANIYVISPFFSENDLSYVSSGIMEYVRKKTNDEVRSLISSYLSENTFFILDQEMSKEETIRYLCDKALDNGDVIGGFYEQVMERERLSATAFFSRFAIPHSNIQNANETRLYVMINKQDIVWNEDNSIKVVILILIKRQASDDFRKLYTGITETLYRNSNAFNYINRIHSLDDFIELFFE